MSIIYDKLQNIFFTTTGILVSETFVVQDCDYFNSTEKSHSSTNASSLYDSNLALSMSSNYEVSFDLYSTHSSGGQHRHFIVSKASYGNGGTTQPNQALWIDTLGSAYDYGKRENNSTVNFNCKEEDISTAQYTNIRMVRDGTTVKIYRDDVLKTTQTITWLDNYSDYSISFMFWSSSGTSKIKNVKFKKL